MYSIFCQTGNENTHWIPAGMTEEGGGIKSHSDRLLSLLLPVPSGISSLPSVHVRLYFCYVYQTVCVSACVHGFPRGCESACVHVCVVCLNASATCGNLELRSWKPLRCWGLFSVVPSFSAFFSFCVFDSSNKLTRLGYSPQYKAVFPFFCSFSCPVFTFFS